MTETKHGKVQAAIVQVMRDAPAIGKTQKNVGQGYSFRGIDDIYNALNKLLSDNGLFTVPIAQEMIREDRESRGGATLVTSLIRMTYRIYHEDGSFVEAAVVGEGMDSGDKASNKAISAAHKYLLIQMFMIPTGEKVDSEFTDHEVVKPKMLSKAPDIVTPVKTSFVMAMKVLEEEYLARWKTEAVFEAVKTARKITDFSTLTRTEQEAEYKVFENFLKEAGDDARSAKALALLV